MLGWHGAMTLRVGPRKVLFRGGDGVLGTHTRRRRVRHTIPERGDQVKHRQAKGSAGGRPRKFDVELYRRRNTVERSFGRFKQWRGIATRYAKYARTYFGRVLLAAVVLVPDSVKRHALVEEQDVSEVDSGESALYGRPLGQFGELQDEVEREMLQPVLALFPGHPRDDLLCGGVTGLRVVIV
jgi:hypothetical protein